MAREMLSRLAEANISGAWRLVMRSVLLGGEGWLKGGRSVRSRERFGDCRFRPLGEGEAGLDDGGVETSIAVVAMMLDDVCSIGDFVC